MKKTLYATVLAVVGALALSHLSSAASQTVMEENFTKYPTSQGCSDHTDGSSIGQWKVIFTGYGCVRVKNHGQHNALELRPRAVTNSGDTAASLVVGPDANKSFTYSGTVSTAQQLRQNSAPNAWETAWIVWNYKDNDHFYYLVPKENGWELGKRDPAYTGGQRFLATGSDTKFDIKAANNFVVKQNDNTMSVSVNGKHLATFTDKERPITSGKIGVYTEDATITATNIRLTNDDAANPTPVTPQPTKPVEPKPAPVTPQPTKPENEDKTKPAPVQEQPKEEKQAPEEKKLADTGNNTLLAVAAGTTLVSLGAWLIIKKRS